MQNFAASRRAVTKLFPPVTVKLYRKDLQFIALIKVGHMLCKTGKYLAP